MCSVCNSFNCHPSCPNAPEPEDYGICKSCGEFIVGGEKIVDMDGDLYHYECLTVEDLLEILGYKTETAGER